MTFCALPSASPAVPAAWTLRDEIAMRLAAAMVVKGTWETGDNRRFQTMPEYSAAAYLFADYMLAAREVPTPAPAAQQERAA